MGALVGTDQREDVWGAVGKLAESCEVVHGGSREFEVMGGDREKGALSRIRFENPRVEFDFSIALNSTLAFFRNGSMILAGTDSPNPGTTPGASIHRELELLVEAGMPHIEALKAATANGAKSFGLNDRGRIANGLKADLILVDGNPAESITDTRNIKGIWKAGKQVQ